MPYELIKTPGKRRNLYFSTVFLKTYIAEIVAPKSIYIRIKKAHVKHSPTMEHAFMKDDLRKNCALATNVMKYCRSLWSEIKTFLSSILFDIVATVSIIDKGKAKETQEIRS